MKSGENPALSRNGKQDLLASPISASGLKVVKVSEAEHVRKSKFICFLFLLVSPWVAAQETVLDALKVTEENNESLFSPVRITSEDLQLQRASSLADILKNIPGVEVVRQGGPGQMTSVFIRGARSEDTLVLIDGLEANDAMSPGAGFDFSVLSAENIERIEVYRGPQSVRFGSGALGGVINIITKAGTAESRVNFLTEVGSYQTYRQALSTSGKIDHLGYSFGFDQFSTAGFSAASEDSGNHEPDGAQTRAASARLAWSLGETFQLKGTLRYTDAETDIDTQGGANGDDPNNKTQGKQIIAGLSASHRAFNDLLKSTIGFYYSEVDRRSRNLPDATNITDSKDIFLSENRKWQIENELLLSRQSTIRLILNWREESGFADSIFNGFPNVVERKTQSVTGESLTYLFENDQWLFEVGARADQSSKSLGISSFKTSLGRKFSESASKAYLSYGTGFKLPSLYQLYSSYGDPSLQQEVSHAIEFGLEQQISHHAQILLSGFDNRYDNLIDYNSVTNKYFNLSRAQSQGWELQANFLLQQPLTFSGTYTYLESKDKKTGLRLLRRPQNVWTFSVRYNFSDYEFFGHYTYRDQREDIDPTTFRRLTNPAYDLVHFGGGYRFKNWLKVYCRIENVFARKYEEVAGYGTPGRSLSAGLSGEF